MALAIVASASVVIIVVVVVVFFFFFVVVWESLGFGFEGKTMEKTRGVFLALLVLLVLRPNLGWHRPLLLVLRLLLLLLIRARGYRGPISPLLVQGARKEPLYIRIKRPASCKQAISTRGQHWRVSNDTLQHQHRSAHLFMERSQNIYSKARYDRERTGIYNLCTL